MKNLILFIALLVCIFITSCNDDTTIISEKNDVDLMQRSAATICHSDVIDPINGIITGTAKLVRTNSKVSMNVKINDLVPGHAYTMWWVIWNNPENCGVPYACSDADFLNPDAVKVEVLYATGHVVGGSGQGNFSASLNENDDDNTINPDFLLPLYGGLLDARKAEVHVVLRSHGPKVPGIVNEQIGSYGGGCDDFYGFPPFTEVPDEVGECGDIMFAIFSSDCG